MDYSLLIQKAVEAKKFAYAPYSNFKVGAALLTTDGKIYTGCNIENSSYGLTICAERTAIFKAMSEGKRKFSAIAISGDTDNYLTPCGACRQIIFDHCGNIDIVLINKNLDQKIFSTNDLLPLAFGDSDLKSNRK
ncbi:MAG TPA: cytidine deaminase [Ignavibacteriaceae bacterium]|nr:cytidine deaminase [Ignavibacteriaceae bacterium]